MRNRLREFALRHGVTGAYLLQGVAPARVLPRKQRKENLLFGGKVIVDGSPRERGFPAYVLDGDLPETRSGIQLVARRDNLVLPEIGELL